MHLESNFRNTSTVKLHIFSYGVCMKWQALEIFMETIVIFHYFQKGNEVYVFHLLVLIVPSIDQKLMKLFSVLFIVKLYALVLKGNLLCWHLSNSLRLTIYSLLDKIIDLSKLKAFSDDTLKLARLIEFISESVENILGTREKKIGGCF